MNSETIEHGWPAKAGNDVFVNCGDTLPKESADCWVAHDPGVLARVGVELVIPSPGRIG